jgi:hypothetical protein
VGCCSSTGRTLLIIALPTILKDSLFCDYQAGAASRRKRAMRHWIDAVRAVGGIGSVNWHPHTLTDDCGWHEGSCDLLTSLLNPEPILHCHGPHGAISTERTEQKLLKLFEQLPASFLANSRSDSALTPWNCSSKASFFTGNRNGPQRPAKHRIEPDHTSF